MAKKIVYLIPGLHFPSGMERVLTLKANYLADEFGYDVTVILTEEKDKPFYFQAGSTTVQTYYFYGQNDQFRFELRPDVRFAVASAAGLLPEATAEVQKNADLDVMRVEAGYYGFVVAPGHQFPEYRSGRQRENRGDPLQPFQLPRLQ